MTNPVRYTKPTPFVNDEKLSAGLSNRVLAESVDEGLTLVASYWGGPRTNSMSWLDVPCNDTGCRDVYTDQNWPWICNGTARTSCNSYRISNLHLSTAVDFHYKPEVTAKNYTTFFIEKLIHFLQTL